MSNLKPPPIDQINKKKSEEELKEEEFDKIIKMGAPVKEDIKKEETQENVKQEENKQEEKEKWKLVPVRMPEKLLKELDDKIEKRIGLSRNAWILEAIQEKMRRENKGKESDGN